MAGRKDKNIVDYFPHYCTSGKTLFIIESKFGHTGYSVWFKTLELLGSSENHFIDLREESDLLFLVSKLKITELQLTEIYDLCAKLNAIDNYLWSKKIIFSDNFIKNINDAYKRRNNKCMQKLDLCKHLGIKCSHKKNKSKQESAEERKEEERKEEERKQKEIDNRSKLFYSKLQPYLKEYSKDMIRRFYDFWTEPNKSNTKMRFELEKTWLLSARLKRWSNNDFGKKKTDEIITDASTIYKK